METQASALFARARSVNTHNPEDDENDNVWELVAEAWTLVAQAARIRAEAATAAGNTDAAEGWLLAADAATSYAQAAAALAAGTWSIAVGYADLPPPLTDVEADGRIATSFGTTKLDHYPLDAQRARPERPEPPDLFPSCGPNDSADVCQARIDANEAKLEIYHAELEAYEAGLREPPELPGPPELPEPPHPPQPPELTALPDPPTLAGLPDPPQPPELMAELTELMTDLTGLLAPYPCGGYDHPNTCKIFWEAHADHSISILAEYRENLAIHEQNYKVAFTAYEDALDLYELRYNADLVAYKDALAAHEQSYKRAIVAYEEALALYEQRAAEHSEELSRYSQALTQYSESLSGYQQSMDQYHVWRMVEAQSEIASREQVLAMLRENVSMIGATTLHGLLVHLHPPVVRFDSGKGAPTPQERSEALRAIDNINAWLPYEQHITIGPDANLTDLRAAVELIAESGEFIDVEAWLLAYDNYEPAGTINAFFSESDTCGSGRSHSVHFGKGCGFTAVIQHELLHALGLGGGLACQSVFGGACNSSSFSGPMFYYSHVPVANFPESEMAYASPYDPTHGLSQIDGEVLQSIYVLLHGSLAKYEDVLKEHFGLLAADKGLGVITADDISPETLGPWDDTVIRFSGRVEDWPYSGGLNRAEFGVDWRNGMARPWTVGSPPHGTFKDSGLLGSATWNGNFVGFTPEKEAVHGDSAINVDLA